MGALVHKFCHYCQNTDTDNTPIRECTDPDCPVFSRRMKGKDSVKIIRSYCLTCVDGATEVRNCVENGKGKNPLCIFYKKRGCK